MEKVQKILDKINYFLISKSTKFRRIYNRFLKSSNFTLLQSVFDFIHKFINFIKNIFSFIFSLLYIPIKLTTFMLKLIESQGNKVFTYSKKANWKQLSYRDIFLDILKQMQIVLNRFLNAIEANPKYRKLLFALLFSFGTFYTLYYDYGYLKLIYNDYFDRYLSSYETNYEYHKRPDYYQLERRVFDIINLNIPIYIDEHKRNRIRSIKVNLKVFASNRYIKQYFTENFYLVNDVLNTNIEIIDPDFTLKSEGRKILKDKIRRELNALIKKSQIKGKIERISISRILAG